MKPDEARIARWISEPRFEPFINATDGDVDRALALYCWNARASAAFFEALSYLEVLLRNAVDETFLPNQSSVHYTQTWLNDSSVLNERSLEVVGEIVERIELTGKEPTRGRVVAGTSFGFWKAMFNRRYENLWRSHIHRAFTGKSVNRSDVARRLTAIAPFRNRLAHHEPIIKTDLERMYREIFELIEFVDPDAPGWVDSCVGVHRAIELRPK